MSFIPVCSPTLDGRELEYVTEAVSSGWISSSGKYIKAFEEAFAAYCGAKHAVAVCNGTVALHLALTALGVGEGDEVIVPDFTMVATAFAVCYTGATPVFVDARADTWNIDEARIEERVTPRTKAIIPVHIFGNPCAMGAINAIAARHGLRVLEDAAEAHGAELAGRRTGSLADIAAFSFFANKNLTTGEGGMVVTNDPELHEKAIYHRNMCFPLDGPRRYLHADIGFNYRMSNLHAAIGLAQVERADEHRARRVRNGKLYRKLLGPIPGVVLQQDTPDALNVFWMNGVLLDPGRFGASREELLAHLNEQGVDTRLFFTGMSRQPCMAKRGAVGAGEDFPVAARLARDGFYLPSSSSLAPEQIEHICGLVAAFQQRKGPVQP